MRHISDMSSKRPSAHDPSTTCHKDQGWKVSWGTDWDLENPIWITFYKTKNREFPTQSENLQPAKRLFFYLVAKMIVMMCMRIYLYIVESSPKNSSRVNLNGYLIQKQSPQILQGWVVPCGTHFWFIRSKFLSPSKPNNWNTRPHQNPRTHGMLGIWREKLSWRYNNTSSSSPTFFFCQIASLLKKWLSNTSWFGVVSTHSPVSGLAISPGRVMYLWLIAPRPSSWHPLQPSPGWS